ncbi:MAG TPA: AAA family ATPase, partial [Candidatus Babeliales bacterium]|nr:AAA family ATPase [Candidatus Babeliales bacterium]
SMQVNHLFLTLSLVLVNFNTADCVNTQQHTALILMGASCAGKSTVSKALVGALGPNWKLVELDVIEEQLRAAGEDHTIPSLLAALVRTANAALAAGDNIVIDTNVYDPILATIATAQQKYILIDCPLEALLIRDEQRNQRLRRNPKRAGYAREYLLKTHAKFAALKQRQQYDLTFDSSINTVNEMVRQVQLKVESTKLASASLVRSSSSDQPKTVQHLDSDKYP